MSTVVQAALSQADHLVFKVTGGDRKASLQKPLERPFL